MNQSIWKFAIPLQDTFTVEMPEESKVLCVQIDQATGCPCIWVLVYPEKKREMRSFETLFTGQTILNDMGSERKYIGTYQFSPEDLGFNLVCHLFENL